jgi:signal transduction histidine kinase
MKLARLIILLTLATFLMLLAAIGLLEARTALRDARARAVTELELTGRALRPSFDEVRNVEGMARALALVSRADSEISVAHIRWVSFAELSGAAASTPDMPEADLQALAAGRDVAILSEESRDDYPLRVYVPVAGAGGAIELSAPMTESQEVARSMVLDRLAVTGAATIGAVALIAWIGIAVIGRPMQALTVQARRIGTGDLSHRLALSRRDEIGELASEMNAMCESLLAARARVAAETDARMTAVEQLRRADRLGIIGTLASGIAHELGTPLTVISGRAKTLANGEQPGETVREYARTILGQADRMTKIIRGLLDFARGKTAQKVSVDLCELTRRTLELLAPLGKKHSVRLGLEDGDGESFAVARVDATQIEQVLANLVVNGIQAMKGGGDLSVGIRHVRARLPRDPDAPARTFLRISVTDTGTGIAPGDLPRVFEPFYTTKDVGEGTGLGLSIAYGIMQDHGGFIDAQSEVGRGSTFSLYFPE